jgi:hypothetical protein
VRVSIRQQGADAQQDFRYRQSRRPLVFENIQTDLSRGVYVTVVNPRSKGNFRRLEWIIGRVVNVQEEDASVIRRPCHISLFLKFVFLREREREKERDEFLKLFFKAAEKKRKESKSVCACVPGGPMIVLTHSYKLSPFGPALQFVGGSKLISASSFWMRLAAELIPDLLIFSFFLSFFLLFLLFLFLLVRNLFLFAFVRAYFVYLCLITRTNFCPRLFSRSKLSLLCSQKRL